MNYVIEIRLIGESETGLIVKGKNVLKFDTEELARTYAKDTVEKSRYVASWRVLPIDSAIQLGHKIDQ